ncbi:MAG: NUDIX domain-containing protein [bacterium]|nr:NUDIX domain-containing protein [bacterium]
MRNKNQILIGAGVIYKQVKKDRKYLIVKKDDEDKWEFPRIVVRRGESSVRAVIRMLGEAAGIGAKVLEEVSRVNSIVMINGKPMPQRLYYYLLIQKAAGEIIGFDKFEWLDKTKAGRKLFLKREKDVLKESEKMIKVWEKEEKKKNLQR